MLDIRRDVPQTGFCRSDLSSCCAQKQPVDEREVRPRSTRRALLCPGADGHSLRPLRRRGSFRFDSGQLHASLPLNPAPRFNPVPRAAQGRSPTRGPVMALAKLANAPAPHVDKGPACAVCRALEVLPKAEADGLVALMGNPQWSFKSIAEHIGRDEDYKPGGKLAEFSWVRDIAGSTYGRHANAGCSARVRLRPRR